MKPKKLNFMVQVPNSATAKDLKGMSWQSLLFYHFLRLETLQKKTNGMWISRSSTDCQKKFTKNYRRHIDDLLKRNWIEENPRYKNDKNGFTKSYRLGETYQYRHKKHPVPLLSRKWHQFAGKHKEDTSDQSSLYLQLIKQRHDTLSFVGTAKGKEATMLKNNLDQQKAGVRKYAKSGRVGSAILSRKKTARKHVLFGDSGWLVNIDVTGMVQQLLNWEIKDSKWNQWIRDDFTDTLKLKMDLKGNRKSIKKLFMTAISREVHSPKAKEVRDFLAMEFPEIMDYIDKLNAIEKIQPQTQRMEAQLITAFIESHPEYQLIPAHDGVFCGERVAHYVEEELQIFLVSQGLLGCTKINCYNPASEETIKKLKSRTIVDILSELN